VSLKAGGTVGIVSKMQCRR